MKTLPDPSWIESVVVAFERHPFGALVLFGMLLAIVYWGTHRAKT